MITWQMFIIRSDVKAKHKDKTHHRCTIISVPVVAVLIIPSAPLASLCPIFIYNIYSDVNSRVSVVIL